MPSPSEYLASNSSSGFNPSGVATLYYPGAGTDYGPIRMVLEAMDREKYEQPCRTAFLSVYYVDYSPDATLEKIRKFLGSELPQNLDPYRRYIDEPFTGVELSPEDFGAPLEKFFSDEGMFNAADQDFFGLRCTYPGLQLCVTYLKTEALATLKVMTRKGIHPNMVVLQDHGWGGNWFSFSGADSPLRKVLKVPPRYLYVGGNTESWPGYNPVSEASIDPGQGFEFPHPRKLFEYRRSRHS